MAEHSLAELLLLKQFDKNGLSKHRGLYFAIRSAIQDKLILPGIKLPSSRNLANDLNLSRSTVTNAFDQLIADGFLESRTGAGTYIAKDIPQEQLKASPNSKLSNLKPPILSNRGQMLCDVGKHTPDFVGMLFTPGPPDTQNFPYTLWSSIYNKHSKQEEVHLEDLGAGGGYGPLRHAIADYIRGTRAIRCEPEQVFITAGTYQSLHLILQMMTSPGDDAWMEDPGYQVAQGALAASELITHPVPVDEQGLSLEEGLKLAPKPKIMFLTPSYQFPTGNTMSRTRRAEILNFCADNDSWIIEDDYDNEFRFDERPLPSLYSMDNGCRSFYLGTFNKVLTSTLRVGYIIVPPQLVEPFRQAYSVLGNESLLLTQAALAEFMTQGHLAKHIRRMRGVYTERRQALINALNKILGETDSLKSREAGGMHLVLDIKGPLSDQQLRQQANGLGLGGRALTDLRLGASQRQGLVLGFTAAPVPYLEQGAEVITKLIHDNGCRVT